MTSRKRRSTAAAIAGLAWSNSSCDFVQISQRLPREYELHFRRNLANAVATSASVALSPASMDAIAASRIRNSSRVADVVAGLQVRSRSGLAIDTSSSCAVSGRISREQAGPFPEAVMPLIICRGRWESYGAARAFPNATCAARGASARPSSAGVSHGSPASTEPAIRPASSVRPLTPIYGEHPAQWVFTVFGEMFSLSRSRRTDSPNDAWTATRASAASGHRHPYPCRRYRWSARQDRVVTPWPPRRAWKAREAIEIAATHRTPARPRDGRRGCGYTWCRRQARSRR